MLTKLLKDHRKRDKEAKRLRAVQTAPAVCEGRAVVAGGGRAWQEGAGKRGGARERGTRTDSRGGSEDMDSALPAVLPLEESDALRLLEAQVRVCQRRERARGGASARLLAALACEEPAHKSRKEQCGRPRLSCQGRRSRCVLHRGRYDPGADKGMAGNAVGQHVAAVGQGEDGADERGAGTSGHPCCRSRGRGRPGPFCCACDSSSIGEKLILRTLRAPLHHAGRASADGGTRLESALQGCPCCPPPSARWACH